MGADYLQVGIPLAKYTEEREKALVELVDRLTVEDFKDHWEMESPEYLWEELGKADAAGCTTEEDRSVFISRLRYKEDAEEYWDLDGRRDCGVLEDDNGTRFIATGGPSWGDSPTESFDVIERLSRIDRIISHLHAWAEEDNLLVPDAVRYLLVIFGDVEPELQGPFETEEDRVDAARRHQDDMPEDGLFRVTVSGGDVTVDTFSSLDLNETE